MRAAEIVPGLIRRTNEFQFWSFVELETVWPWFYVETKECSAGSCHTGTILAPNVQLLRDLVRSKVNAAWVNQIQIITPGDMNGTGFWKMEILEAFHEVFDAHGQVLGYEYKVSTGSVYSTMLGRHDNIIRRLLYMTTKP